MACNQLIRVPAYFDHELDVHTAAAMEQHLPGCVECTAQLRELQQMRRALTEQAPYYRAGAALEARIQKALDRDSRVSASPAPIGATRRSFWLGAAGGVFATAAAAAVAFFLFAPSPSDRLIADLTSAHVRSLLPDHLFDVVSTDRHTVKPWFAGHAEVSPPVTDFAREGYPLAGGRVDYVDGRRAAVVVYRHGAHIANVFVWPSDSASLPRESTRNGYRTVCWRGGDLAFCAVSDMALQELLELQRLIRE